MEKFIQEGNITDKLDLILAGVERPSRYTGGEWNSVERQDAGILADICLCYPDLYEIGSSAPGLGLLYSVINSTGRFSAQRCYAPKEDFFKELKKNKIPLFSLETKKPLAEFDAVGFTLQHELSATNVLYILDAAGIPFRACERSAQKDNKQYPLIVGGGPLTLNPEPLAEFFDVFIIGDGEEAAIELMELIASFKKSASAFNSSIGENGNRYELLKRIAREIKGAYVPLFYELFYDEKGDYRGLKKKEVDAPDFIQKRIHNISKSPSHYYDAPVVPNSASVQGRLVVEVARGCPHRCSFCSARIYYGPWRLRSKEAILETVKNGLKNTGYDEVSFASLSSGDYPGLADLLEAVSSGSGVSPYPISLAIPSVHCRKFTPRLASVIAARSASRPSLTFAPETGCESLRFSVGKNLTDESIISAVRAAISAGWKQAKFYFMYGLPGETEQDIEGIVKLVKKIKSNFRNFGIKVSLSPFVPKPHTVFEKEKFDSIESLKAKFSHIRKQLGGIVETHQIEASFIEALIARGDRRMCRVIESAYKSGAKFDQWREGFSYQIWLEAFKSEGIDPFEYVNRYSGDSEAVLPWRNVSFEWKKSDDEPDFSKIDETQSLDDLSDISLQQSVTGQKKDDLSVVMVSPQGDNQRALRFRVRMSREGLARFISNNEQIEIIRRSARRAKLPLAYSTGFHPQPKISFGPAISVGYESRAEYFEAEFTRYVAPQEIMDRLNSFLPRGYRVLSARQVPTMFASFESLCAAVEYSVKVLDSDGKSWLNSGNEGFYTSRISEFLSHKESLSEADEEGRRLDVRSLVRSAVIDRTASGEGIFRMIVNIIPGRNLKAEKITRHILGLVGDDYQLRITRERFFYLRKKDNAIFEV